MVSKNPDATGGIPAPKPVPASPLPPTVPNGKVAEIGGPKGPEPTRYGDWEVNGRVSDF